MELKNHDCTEREQRLEAVDSPLLQQDKTVRAALLFIIIFGVAALAGVVTYLAWPYSIPGLLDTCEVAFHTGSSAKRSMPYSNLLSHRQRLDKYNIDQWQASI